MEGTHRATSPLAGCGKMCLMIPAQDPERATPSSLDCSGTRVLRKPPRKSRRTCGTTSDFDNRRRRDSASIWAIKDSGNRTVSVFIVPVVLHNWQLRKNIRLSIGLSFTLGIELRAGLNSRLWPEGSELALLRSIEFVSQKRRGWLSAFRLCRLSRTHTWSAAVLVDEPDVPRLRARVGSP